MMRRREFLATTAALAAAPRLAWAQEKRRLAIVVNAAPVSVLYKGGGVDYGAYGLLIEGLEEHGWIEGQNLVIERYSAEGNADLLPALAQAVVNSGPDLIYARSGQMLAAIMAATDTIPVVNIGGQENVKKYAKSLARPGGNFTGLTVNAGSGLEAKRLQLLHDVVPSMTRVAWLAQSSSWARRNENPSRRAALEFANKLGIAVVPWLFDYPGDVDIFRRLFSSSAEVDGLMIQANTLGNELKATVVGLAKDARLPTITRGRREYVDFGGLMYYDTDVPALFSRAAWYVDQILKGADPGELPIEQPTRFDFIINLKTAKEIGIEFPLTILYRTTEVIE